MRASGSDGTAGKTLVIACGALAREILDIVSQPALSHVELRCLPAILHNHPERIVPRLREAIARARSDGYVRIHIGYADCGTGGDLARLAEELDVEMLPGAHCYAFYEGVEAFAERDEVDAFYLTDFLARHFEAFVVAPLRLREHPELIEMMFGNYGRVVQLVQAPSAEVDRAAQRAADFLGLPLERRTTGYGDLATALQDAGRGKAKRRIDLDLQAWPTS